MSDKVYVKKLPTAEELQNRVGLKTPIKYASLPANDYSIAVKLFDMAHGIQADRLDEFVLVKREEFRDLLRAAQ